MTGARRRSRTSSWPCSPGPRTGAAAPLPAHPHAQPPARRSRSPSSTRSPGWSSRWAWPIWTGSSTTRVPASMGDSARPGVRVRVRFSGREVGGYVVDRRAEADHAGRLDADPAGRVRGGRAAARAAGAVPAAWPGAGPARCPTSCAWPSRPGNATAERSPGRLPPPVPERPAPGPWADYTGRPGVPGPPVGRRLRCGPRGRPCPVRSGRRPWPARSGTAAAAGRGALVVLPDHRDVDRVELALRELLGPDQHVRLTADQGPQARYAAWLRVLRGQARIVVGTRSAALAPVSDLGLVVCWDDGDDLHAEPHAPYWHVREVLALRSEAEGAAALFGGLTRTAEVQRMVEQGWARPVGPAAAPAAHPGPAGAARGRGAGAGPRCCGRVGPAVLAGLADRPRGARDRPGAGAGAALRVPARPACQDCRTPARCRTCHGPLAVTRRGGPPSCRWCGRADAAWVCPVCEGTRLRASVVGSRRTAEELGRAFPGVPVRTSGGRHGCAEVPDAPGPGGRDARRRAGGRGRLRRGAAARRLGAARAPGPARRRGGAAPVAGAAALVRPASAGGTVVLSAPAGLPPVEALVRWDPAWHADRELAERIELRLPARRAGGDADRQSRCPARGGGEPDRRAGLAGRRRCSARYRWATASDCRRCGCAPRARAPALADALRAAQGCAVGPQGAATRSGSRSTRSSWSEPRATAIASRGCNQLAGATDRHRGVRPRRGPRPLGSAAGVRGVLPAEEIDPFLAEIDFHRWNRALDAGRPVAEAEAEIDERFPHRAGLIAAYRRNFRSTLAGGCPARPTSCASWPPPASGCSR